MSNDLDNGVKPLPPRPQMVEALRELIALGPDNPKMPEGVFVSFLRSLYNPLEDKFDVELWYRTFGSYRQSVEVLDPMGNVVRVCPPIVGTVNTKVGVDRQASLSTLVETAQLMERRHAGLAERTMTDGLAAYQEAANSTPHEAWRAILTHYGIIQSTQAPGDPSATATMDLLTGEVDEV